jgi:hypothetical protein
MAHVTVIIAVGIAVAAVSQNQHAEVCVLNELVYETTYWSIDKARYDKIWKCKDCPLGTYGSKPSVCPSCPAFTWQLKNKKAGIAIDSGTLWCENRCENLKDNNNDNVNFISHVNKLVLM